MTRNTTDLREQIYSILNSYSDAIISTDYAPKSNARPKAIERIEQLISNREKLAIEKVLDSVEQNKPNYELLEAHTQSKLKAFAGEVEEAIGGEIMCYDGTDISHKFMSCDTCQSNMRNHELRQALKAIKERNGIE